MRDQLCSLKPKVKLLLALPVLAIAYPLVTIVLPELIRAVLPQAVRTVLSLI